MATPSKPRIANSIFGHRTLSNIYQYPTPIREEPGSERERSVRAAFIAETPVGPGRMSAVPFVLDRNVVKETPRAPRFGNVMEEADEEGEEDEDELGELMVMTDDEDEGELEDGGWKVIPETPVR